MERLMAKKKVMDETKNHPITLMLFNSSNDRNLTKDFRASEFFCPCCKYALIDLEMIVVVQKIREFLAKTVTVNSGWRCPKHNEAIGGAEFSVHLRGGAADLTWSTAKRDLKSEVFRNIIRKIPGIKGIGWGKTFLHIDVWMERTGLIEWSYL